MLENSGILLLGNQKKHPERHCQKKCPFRSCETILYDTIWRIQVLQEVHHRNERAISKWLAKDIKLLELYKAHTQVQRIRKNQKAVRGICYCQPNAQWENHRKTKVLAFSYHPPNQAQRT